MRPITGLHQVFQCPDDRKPSTDRRLVEESPSGLQASIEEMVVVCHGSSPGFLVWGDDMDAHFHPRSIQFSKGAAG